MDGLSYNTCMTKEGRQLPFSSHGKIEAVLEPRFTAHVVEDFHARKLDVEPFDPAISEKAEEALRLDPTEPAVLCDRYGNPLLRTVKPSVKRKDNGRLVEEWLQPADIFAARDKVIEIIAKYSEGGTEFNHRKLVGEAMDQISERLQDGPLSNEQREELKSQTLSSMIEARYTESLYPERVRTANDLKRATQKDSLGRPNNPAGRFIVASRRPQLKKDELVADRTLKRNYRKLAVIEGYCDLMEKNFEYVASLSQDVLDNVISMDEYRAAVNYELSPVAGAIPKPYSELAARLRYILFAKDFEHGVINLSLYMKNLKEAILFSDDYPPFGSLTEEAEKLKRITDVARLMREGLKVIATKRYGEEVA